MDKKNNRLNYHKQFKRLHVCFAEDFGFWIPDCTDIKLPIERENNPDANLHEYLGWLAKHLSETDYCLTEMHSEILRTPNKEHWEAERLACYVGGAALSEFYEIWGTYVLESDPKTIEADAIFPLDTDGRYIDITYLDFVLIQQCTLLEKKRSENDTPFYYDIGWRPLLKNAIDRAEDFNQKVSALHSFYNEFQELYSKN